MTIFGLSIHWGPCKRETVIEYREGVVQEDVTEMVLQLCHAYRLTGHLHWDSTGQHGAGCEKCIADRKIKDSIDKTLRRPGIVPIVDLVRHIDWPNPAYAVDDKP